MEKDKIIVDDKISMVKLNRNYNKTELERNLKLLNDKAVQDYLGFDENIDKELEHINLKLERGDNIYYSIYKNGEFIGWFYLYDIKKGYKRANISLGLTNKKRGHILSLTMIRRVIEELFNMGYNRLGIEIEDTNEESLRMMKHLEKIGFKYEGKLRDNYGIGINSNVWSLLSRDYYK